MKIIQDKKEYDIRRLVGKRVKLRNEDLSTRYTIRHIRELEFD